MLIPSIDLLGGQAVQLVQGRRRALAFDDVFAWADRFAGFRRVQVIDLDGAFATGSNEAVVRQLCTRLQCRVGGGVRNAEQALQWIEAGASEVIVGTSLFLDGRVDTAFAEALARDVGVARIIAAVDSVGGLVVTRGWREPTTLTPEEAVRQLEPYCGGFLYTHVETEGMMKGIDMAAVARVKAATSRPISAAGGITTDDEVAALEAQGIDAVVGMAIYTGRLALSTHKRDDGVV
jgi:phosphoribosylformimino-5-aminoimidazole carboxamide ribotide isomerase